MAVGKSWRKLSLYQSMAASARHDAGSETTIIGRNDAYHVRPISANQSYHRLIDQCAVCLARLAEWLEMPIDLGPHRVCVIFSRPENPTSDSSMQTPTMAIGIFRAKILAAALVSFTGC